MKEFDENEAVKAMNDALFAAYGIRYDDDEVLNVLDMIWDWYDDNGLTDIDIDDHADESAEPAAIVTHIKKLLAKDSDSPVKPDHVETLVKAEIDYENSISLL